VRRQAPAGESPTPPEPDPDTPAAEPEGAAAVPDTPDAVSAGTTDTSAAAAPPDGDAAPRPDPVDLLRGLWRGAVAAGETSEGFDAWLSAALSPQDAAPPQSHAARTRGVAASWDRRAAPVTLGRAGRVVTTFGDAIPTAFCSPLTVCYIELEPGEELTDTPSWGDTARWQVVAKIQGRDPETVVLEIKPAADAGGTNLVIPTDRRLYTISLVNDPDVHTPILSFRWPDSEARAIAGAVAARRAEERAEAAARAAAAAVRDAGTAAEMERSGVPTGSGPRPAELLDFRFRVDGRAPFRPVRVFADGSRTYFDLHPDYRGPLPTVVAGRAEGNAALNTRISASGSRLVADRVITDVWLRSGRQRVRIRRIAE